MGTTSEPNSKVYIRPFNKNNQWYTGNRTMNEMYLKCQENYANEKLKYQGYLFLNDVYDMLGYTRTRDGQRMGWRDGNTVKFNVSEDGLEFNVSGDISDILDEE